MLPQNLVHPTPTLEKMEEKKTHLAGEGRAGLSSSNVARSANTL